MSDTLAFALETMADLMAEKSSGLYGRAKRIRDAQETDPDTKEIVNADPDQMYELGHADGASMAYGTLEEKLRGLANIAREAAPHA